MSEFLLRFFEQFGFKDLFDVLLVAVCFYYLLVAIRGTRAVQIIQGLIVLILLLAVARIARLETLTWILGGLAASAVVAVPVVFQPELRRTLMHLGRRLAGSSALAGMEREELSHLVDEVAFAATELSQLRHGALIVFERETGLEDIIETGQPVGGLASAKLLLSIFNPGSPLHDGAVILRGNELVAAACYLPLSDRSIPFGTRHRASLGLSEQSDAVVLVISEETGEIRVAQEGRFERVLANEGDVKRMLNKLLMRQVRESRGGGSRSR